MPSKSVADPSLATSGQTAPHICVNSTRAKSKAIQSVKEEDTSLRKYTEAAVNPTAKPKAQRKPEPPANAVGVKQEATAVPVSPPESADIEAVRKSVRGGIFEWQFMTAVGVSVLLIWTQQPPLHQVLLCSLACVVLPAVPALFGQRQAPPGAYW